jgi:DNA-binding response OmpR family regulator/nitrogen-specific signal transduction histidine kinase
VKELGDKWTSTMPGEKSITFWRLPSGKYNLEIRACENDDISTIKTITIMIDTPWYLTGWAYLCYVIILLVACYYIYKRFKQKRMERINEDKVKFFINVSHELRAPLTMIINPLERLMKEERDTPIYRDLKLMHKHSVRILSLINQLLDIRKMDKGQMKIKSVESDLVSFIEELCYEFSAQAEKRNITLTFNHEMEHLPVWIDPNNFDKVIVNLIGNAFKYTPDGGAITVTLSTENNGKGKAVISVADTGKGIDKDKLEKVFDRFYQIDSTHMGFGIGLNLCKMMVNLHHGTITALNRGSEPGSEFVVKLPLGKSHLTKGEIGDAATAEQLQRKEQHYIPETEAAGRAARSKTNYKVLIVDDDDEVREFIAHELESEYKIITANNGEEGLREAVAKMPDVIVSDVVMPEMDGIQMLKNLKWNVNTNHIPVILLTSKVDLQDRMQGLERGADAYLTKPFIIDELRSTVANLIANRLLLKGKYSGAQEQHDKMKEIDIKSNNDVLMDKIMKIVNEHLDDSELSVEMLADTVGLSRAQLHRKIKEMTGLPASEFIRNIRLKQAAALLKDRKLNVSQVAYAVGFVNLGHFSTVFKKYYGVSPTEYGGGVEVEQNAVEEA